MPSVDFDFDADQNALRDAVRTTLARALPRDRSREIVDAAIGGEVRLPDDVWSTIAELGWTGLLVPEAYGGLGLGLVDMTVVMEEMGALPLPGPFFSSAVLATLVALRLGAT